MGDGLCPPFSSLQTETQSLGKDSSSQKVLGPASLAITLHVAFEASLKYVALPLPSPLKEVTISSQRLTQDIVVTLGPLDKFLPQIRTAGSERGQRDFP